MSNIISSGMGSVDIACSETVTGYNAAIGDVRIQGDALVDMQKSGIGRVLKNGKPVHNASPSNHPSEPNVTINNSGVSIVNTVIRGAGIVVGKQITINGRTVQRSDLNPDDFNF